MKLIVYPCITKTSMIVHPWLAGILLFMGSLFVIACGSSISIETPDEFVKKEDPYTHDYLSVSSEYSVFTVKKVENWKNGTPNYWMTIVHKDLTEKRGYEPVGDPTPTTAKDGTAGLTRVYLVPQEEEKRNYIISIFAIADRTFFYVLEYQGLSTQFDAEKTKILDSMKTFKGDYGKKLKEK